MASIFIFMLGTLFGGGVGFLLAAVLGVNEEDNK